MDVSVIIPVYNAEEWLEECLASVAAQTAVGKLKLQVSVYDDNSTDGSSQILRLWKDAMQGVLDVVISRGDGDNPGGVGLAKNRAVKQSTGKFLCFADADDVMLPSRVELQYEVARRRLDSIVGSRFRRLPADATRRFTAWANSIEPDQLYTQSCLSHGPTLVMPTWFCSRDVYNRVGGFDESGKGTPEDLIFFYRHLDLGGTLQRVDEELVIYRYHPAAATFSVSEDSIWSLRVQRLEEKILSRWNSFCIWNAGKQGRKLYRSLSSKSRAKVSAFCDVDAKKISKGVYVYEETDEIPRPTVPIVHFTEAEKPFVICVKLDLTGGVFEKNLNSLHLQEGVDYYFFN